MPVYLFRCKNSHITELRASVDVKRLVCPQCGLEARRQAVYRDQYINGETVAKGGRCAS
jgi:hypothetical protein